jgi:hypothetical protein
MREKQLDELKKALMVFLDHESRPQEKASLNVLLDLYFKEIVIGLSDRELAEHLGSPQKAIRSFSDFLAQRT